jgi:hypothetical protein
MDLTKLGGGRQSVNVEDRRREAEMSPWAFEQRFDPADETNMTPEQYQGAMRWEDEQARRRQPVNTQSISLDPQTQTNLISLADMPQPVPQSVAQERTQKAELAMGKTSPGAEQIYNTILAGNEQELRNTLSIDRSLELEELRQKMLSEFADYKTSEGKPLTEDDYNFIQSLTYNELANPDTILEKEYARHVVGKTLGDTSVVSDALQEAPEISQTLLDIAEQTIAKREIVQTAIDRQNTDWEDTSWFSSIWDFGETLLPFKSALNVSGTVIGSGTELEKYVADLYRLPVDEFQKKFQADLQEIKDRNALDAQHFAGLVLSYGASSKFLDNALNVADLLAVGAPLAKAGGKGAARVATETDFVVGTNGVARQATAADRLSGGIRSLITSLRTQKLSVPEVLASVGKTSQAGVVNYLKEVKAKYYDRDPEGLSKQLLTHIPSFMNPSKFFAGGYQMARESADRVAARAERNSETLLRGITDKTGINSLGDAALLRAYDLAEKEVRQEFSHVNNSIIDIRRIAPEDTLSGVPEHALILGRPDGSLFENRFQASAYRKEMGIKVKDGIIRDQGDGAFIEIRRPVRQDQNSVKDLLIDLDNQTPTTSVNTFIGSIRSADDLVSKAQREVRKVVTHGTQFLSELLTIATKDLASLSKGSRLRFQRFAESMRDHVYTGPKGEKLRGREFSTLGEFEEAWQDSFGKLPTEAETSAYLSYQQLNQFDYILRNLNVYRFKVRKGIRQYKADKKTPFFEGTTIDKIDWNVKRSDGTVGVLVFSEGVDPFYTTLQFAKSETRELIDDSVANNGYRVIQTWDPFSFKDLTDGPVNLVVTKNAESRNLPFEQIPYRPGGHVVYDYNHYVKQPSVKLNGERSFYNGDTTISPFTTEKEARDYVRSMEEARRLYNEASPETFDDYVWKNLPVAPADLRQKFASGILDKDQPFVHTRRGESTKQHLPQGREWIDWNDSSYNLSRGMNKEFLGQRNWDATAVSKYGDDDNPIFEITKPRLLDPLSTINRAAGTMVRNEYLEPYKIRSAESFVEEFSTVLQGSLEDLRRDPIGVLFNPRWEEGTGNRELLAAAKNYRNAVLDLIGVRSPFQRNWGRVQEKLLNSVYDKLGKGASDWTYEKLLPGIADPIKFGRQVAFHSKLGLLNPVQLFLQAQTFVHTMALSSPGTALKAAPGAILMRLAHVSAHDLDDAFLSKWASHAAAMGWDPEHFKEAYGFIRRSGLFNVNGEHAWRDDMLDPKLIRSTAGVVLDKAAIFFTEGERFNRLAAFNAAYLDWRKANPLARFDRKAQQTVMARQDILSVNMTRASNASWQKGILSVPTQFFSYQQRLFEQLVGKRLTKAEKARVLAVYSAMYGVPVAGGAATMWPMYESMKSYMLENGMTHDNAAFEMVMEGIPAVALEAITGTQYNIGDRYGPGGLKDLRDIWWGDKALLEVALGASGSILGDILKTSKPFLYSITELSREGSKALPLVGRDFVDALSNVSSVNNAYRAYYALQYGKLVTKGEVPVDDVSTVDAIMTGITGLQPQQISDAYLMIESMRHQKDAQQFAKQQAVKYFRRMIKAPADQMEMYARMYKTWLRLGGFRVDQYADILREAASGHEDLVDQVERRFETNREMKID